MVQDAAWVRAHLKLCRSSEEMLWRADAGKAFQAARVSENGSSASIESIERGKEFSLSTQNC
jgi:hypothetical protein